jgi:hypothetical protein
VRAWTPDAFVGRSCYPGTLGCVPGPKIRAVADPGNPGKPIDLGMPAGRPNRPLFDLIAEEGDDARRRGSAPSTATPAVELKPAAPAVRAREPVAIERPEAAPRSRTAPRGLWGSLVSTGRATIELTTPWFAAGVALLLALLLGTWIIAYKVGESEATRRLAGGVSTAPPRPDDSAQGDLPVIIPNFATKPPDPRTEQPPSTENLGIPTDQPTPGPAIADLPAATPGDTGPVVAYTGTYDSDPRIVGRNYLVLASSMSRTMPGRRWTFWVKAASGLWGFRTGRLIGPAERARMTPSTSSFRLRVSTAAR